MPNMLPTCHWLKGPQFKTHHQMTAAKNKKLCTESTKYTFTAHVLKTVNNKSHPLSETKINPMFINKCFTIGEFKMVTTEKQSLCSIKKEKQYFLCFMLFIFYL